MVTPKSERASKFGSLKIEGSSVIEWRLPRSVKRSCEPGSVAAGACETASDDEEEVELQYHHPKSSTIITTAAPVTFVFLRRFIMV